MYTFGLLLVHDSIVHHSIYNTNLASWDKAKFSFVSTYTLLIILQHKWATWVSHVKWLSTNNLNNLWMLTWVIWYSLLPTENWSIASTLWTVSVSITTYTGFGIDFLYSLSTVAHCGIISIYVKFWVVNLKNGVLYDENEHERTYYWSLRYT